VYQTESFPFLRARWEWQECRVVVFVCDWERLFSIKVHLGVDRNSIHRSNSQELHIQRVARIKHKTLVSHRVPLPHSTGVRCNAVYLHFSSLQKNVTQPALNTDKNGLRALRKESCARTLGYKRHSGSCGVIRTDGGVGIWEQYVFPPISYSRHH